VDKKTDPQVEPVKLSLSPLSLLRWPGGLFWAGYQSVWWWQSLRKRA